MTLLKVESALDDADSTGVTQHILRPLMGAAPVNFSGFLATPRTIEKLMIAILGSDCTYCIFFGVAIAYTIYIYIIYIYIIQNMFGHKEKRILKRSVDE